MGDVPWEGEELLPLRVRESSKSDLLQPIGLALLLSPSPPGCRFSSRLLLSSMGKTFIWTTYDLILLPLSSGYCQDRSTEFARQFRRVGSGGGPGARAVITNTFSSPQGPIPTEFRAHTRNRYVPPML
eukprot:763379-Hanusia_phi.AAC.5